jgi:hypothetical protein
MLKKNFILQHYFILHANPKFAYKKNFIKKDVTWGLSTTWDVLLYK